MAFELRARKISLKIDVNPTWSTREDRTEGGGGGRNSPLEVWVVDVQILKI